MTEPEQQTLEEKLAELDRQIIELINLRWKLVNPTVDEVKQAYSMLTDDTLNTCYEVMDEDNPVGRWLIPDEVLVIRQWEDEDGKTTGA